MPTSSAVDLGRYYDTVPYRSYAYPECAPEHLAALAHVLAQRHAGTATARVLELGCASGGNLIPFALRSPASRSVGIDLSEAQVRMGKNLIGRLGLRNIELDTADFTELESRELGKFDYIICHGLYSWIPREVQPRLLRLCKDVLAPGGLVYVSYNTYPGWKSKEVIRDAMLLHCGDRTAPGERVAYAKAMLGFLRKTVASGTMLSHMLEESIDLINRTGDDYLSHDYLEPFNNPCYFGDFVTECRQHGLSYLCESSIRRMRPLNYGQGIAEPLLATFGNDQVRMEQYLDVVINRSFRQTVLIHTPDTGSIAHHIRRERLKDLHFAARLPALSGPTRDDGSPQQYGPQDSVAFSTTNTLAKCMADALTERWPDTHTPATLLSAALDRAAEAGTHVEDAERTAVDLLAHLVNSGMCRMRMHRIASSSATATPRISPETRRMMSALRDDERTVTGVWHESFDLSPEERAAYPLMDGRLHEEEIANLLLQDERLGGEVRRRAARDIAKIIETARNNGMLSEMTRNE